MLQSRPLIALLAAAAGLAAGAYAATRWWKQPAQVRRAFHVLYHHLGEQTYNNTYWLGVPVQQSPGDLWVFQEILYGTRPDVLVEAGTYKGGSALYFASLFDLMGHGRVITIDIEDHPEKRPHARITYLLGSSTAPEIVARVKSLIQPGEKVMVVLDSNHARDHVRNELRLYSPLVAVGLYLVVEDTHFNGHPIVPHFGPGPMEAVHDFLAANPGFASDRSREKFLLTFNPEGWLKRVR